MKHRINREFERVVCISLLERLDKREKMQMKFDLLGIEVQWYEAVKFGFIPKIAPAIIASGAGKFNANQPFEIGASLSHYHVIKQALLEECENIFVFEDDVTFHKDFNEKFEKYFEDLPKNWDVILLYSFMYNILPENVRVSKRWIRSKRAWSMMAYGMNRRAMEEYIRRQDRFFTIADQVTHDMQDDPSFNIYSAIPTLCIPATELGSDIRGQSMNYKVNPTILNMGYSDNNYEKL